MKTKIWSIFGLAAFVIAPLFAWADDLPRPDPTIAEFARGVKFKVNGYQGGAEVQTNFPVLVRLSTAINGFDYNDFYNKTATDLSQIDIGFVDAEGNGLSYDVDTWDPSGESLVWVNLPRMTNGTEFAMWYRSSKTGKDLNPTNAWTEYAGVWHFSEDYGTEAGSVNVYDSTTNELTGATYWSSKCKSSSYTTNKKVGRARKIATTSGTKGIGAITVSLGTSDSPKRRAVDTLGDNFSVSFWLRRESQQYNYIIGRKDGDDYGSWAFQQHANVTRHRIYSNGTTGAENTGYAQADGVSTLNAWVKYDLVYTSEGKFSLYCDGSNKANEQSLIPGAVTQGGLDLYIGGGKDGGNCRPVVGAMDEVRLCYNVPTAARVQADYDTVNTVAFLSADTVVTNQIIERPVVNFTVADFGASHIQFGGTLSSLGASEAKECTFYAKVWPTTDTEPATWTAFATNLTVGTFSGLAKGLTPATAYSYALMISNDVEALSYETRDTFMTSGVGVSGTGGDVTRVGDDWIHYFRVALGDNDAVTNVYTFTPPSYANTVRALVVAGGGPGGYKAGGGGGAGGLIYSNALTVVHDAAYTITVGEGGVASGSTEVFGTSGGDSLITSAGGATTNAIAFGGGAGGNFSNNNDMRIGRGGGSGGGSPHSGANAGSGTQGQGNAGGKGSTNVLAGGGGGAGTEGAAAPSTGNNQNAGAGGAGLECDITGVGVYYAGGGGGGGVQYSKASGSPGAGGNGGGGTGSRKAADNSVSAATSGTDGLGGGGGGGCGDVEMYYTGGDGGDGIVIIRYPSQGDGSAVTQPIISLQSAACNDATFKGEVTFRVAWAGANYQDANVKIKWGYSRNSLIHTTDIVATNVIGVGSGSFGLIADECTVFCRAVAVNGADILAESAETLSFYVADNPNGTVDNLAPAITAVGLSRVDGLYAVVTGLVTSVGSCSPENTESNCTVRVKIGATEDNLSPVATGTFGVGPFELVVSGLSTGTTYFYDVEAEDDAGMEAESSSASFTTLPSLSVLSDITTAVAQRTYTVSGSLATLGAGMTYVLIKWDNGALDEIATFDATSDSLSFSTNYLGRWDASSSWTIVCSNICTLADGTPSGAPFVSQANGTVTPEDLSTYTWQAVEDEWSGNWTNTAHWVSDKADCRGYPNDVKCNAYFVNCTTQNPAIVTIDGKYTVGAFVPNAVNGASDITFRGAGRASSGITATSPVLWSDAKHVCSDTQIKFEEMAVTFNNDWQIMRHAQDAGGPVAYSNILVRFSNVGLTVNNKQLKLCAPYSRLEFTDGTTATAGEVTVSGTDSVLLVDDSAVTANTNLRLGVQCLPNEGEHILFRGAAPKLTAKSWFSPYKITNQPVGVVFEVPVGGYESAPFVFSHNSNTFGQPDTNGKVAIHTFAVSPSSPALKVSGTIENNVLIQTTAGFYETVLGDSTSFTVPEREGSPTGAFKWGVEGAPLAEGAELSTARQLLLNLTGHAQGVMFLIY